MKTLSLMIDTKDIKTEQMPVEYQNKTAPEIFELVIKEMMIGYLQQLRGGDENDREMYYCVKKSVRKAVQNQWSEVELEDAHFGFLKRVKREGKFIPDKDGILEQVDTLIGNVKDR